MVPIEFVLLVSADVIPFNYNFNTCTNEQTVKWVEPCLPDPYVKVYLICDGRRLKKRKTTTKKSTLNPAYNEAIIFDIPPENVEQVSLSIMVMDYDRWVKQSLDTASTVHANALRGSQHSSEMRRITEGISLLLEGVQSRSVGSDLAWMNF